MTCVQCHIGPGASWFARSKVSGMRQVLAVARGSYSRPIASPVQNLRPAREVCEQCHWPEKFHGDKIRRVYEYGDDEKNTESLTTLKVHVGGGSQKMGIATGIHWHMNVANEIEYITTDDKRQVIPYVRVKDQQGNVREYFAEGVTPEQLTNGERRRMDCMDCHNRPSHPMAATAERAVDEALARGEIPRTLPFVRREAVKLLKADYPSQEVAAETIASTLREFYRTQQNAVVHVEASGGGASGHVGVSGLPAQRVPGDERPVRDISEQHRPHGLAWMLPLSRRQPQDARRQGDWAGVRHLPRYRITSSDSVGTRDAALLMSVVNVPGS